MKPQLVLVVEDDKWLAEQYKRVLSHAGFEVTSVPHALAAIQAVDETKFCAIILDLLLTGSTAFALMHELQTYDDTGKIPIILCTSLAGSLDIKDFEPYGVKLILDKSKMYPADMVTALNSVLL
jgi:CheY-like chemotaxis protein